LGLAALSVLGSGRAALGQGARLRQPPPEPRLLAIPIEAKPTPPASTEATAMPPGPPASAPAADDSPLQIRGRAPAILTRNVPDPAVKPPPIPAAAQAQTADLDSACPGIAFVPLPVELGTMEGWEKWAMKEWVAQNPPPPATPTMPALAQPELAPQPKALITHAELACAHQIPPAAPYYQAYVQRCTDGVVDEIHGLAQMVLCDFKNMYLSRNLAYLGLAVGIALPLAETSADETMSAWYQSHVRNINTDRFIEFGNFIGYYQYLVPVYVGTWATGALLRDNYAGSLLYEWSLRTLRGITVGAPAVGVLQYGLGAGRPGEPHGSHWHPLLDNNAVSGNVFVAAVPFLAAASMAENPFIQAAFFAGSFYGGWARFDLDAHYFSQAFLGWSIAFLSARSIVMTNEERRAMDIVPIQVPGPHNTIANGIGVLWHF
jgi:hypothetical protein